MALPTLKPLPSPQGLTTKQGGISTAGYQFLQSLYNGAAAALSQVSEAAAGDYLGNTAGFLALTPETVWAAVADVALTDAASVVVDMATGFNFTVTIAGNRTLANPSNAKPGQSGCFKVTASGGTRTIDVGTNYKKTSDITFPVSIASTQVAYIFYFVDTSSRILVTAVLNNPT